MKYFKYTFCVLGVKCSRSLGPAEDEEGEDEEDTECPEDQTDSTNQTPSRLQVLLYMSG